MKNPQVRALDSYRAGRIVGEAFGKRAIKVIGHLRLELHTLVRPERRASANAKQIRIRLRERK